VKLTERERKLVLVLPAVAVLIGYAWYYSFSVRPRAAQAQRDHEAAVAGAVAPAALAAERIQVAGLQRELKELGETKARLDRNMAAAGNRGELTAGRIATHQDLTGLFRRHALQLVEESRPTAGEAAALPGSLRAALTRVGLKQADKMGELRVYKLAGSYLNVLEAVRELADQPAAAGIPLSLTMAAGDNDDGRQTWTLTVWM
jgi:hypothetical protein